MSGQTITFRPEDIEGAAKPEEVTFTQADIEPAEEPSGPVSRFLGSAWQNLNPVEAVRGLGEAVMSPVDTIKSLLEAQGQVGVRAWEDLKAGNPEAARHVLHYLLPVLGPALDAQAEQIRSGDVASGLGGATGLGTALAAPVAASRAGTLRVPGVRNPNPAVAEAVDAGLAQGIPVDMATAAGGYATKGAQWLVDRSLGGAIASHGTPQIQAEALAARLRTLAEQANAGTRTPGVFTPETAGASAQGSLRSRVGRLKNVADKSYGELRDIEAMPAHQRPVAVTQQGRIGGSAVPVTTTEPMGLPVDMAPVKAALQPIYDDILRRSPTAIRDASPGVKAIENIIHGPDFSPLSVADADLSAIKALARERVLPELRNLSQGVAAKAVREFEAAIQKATAEAGPRATQVRARGRAATRAKYDTGEALKDLGDEPVNAYRKLVQPGDASVERLREIQRQTPEELPKVGRAMLDDFVAEAVAEGEFSKPGTLFSRWQRVGPATKRMLFAPDHVKALDQFFLLAKKMAENPNPSGSGFVVSLTAQGGLLITNPLTSIPLQIGAAGLSKLLHSPRAVRALTRGIQVGVSRPSAVAAVMTELTNAAKDAGVSVDVPAIPQPIPAHTAGR